MRALFFSVFIIAMPLPGLEMVAFAEPLPKERCEELSAELKLLEGGGAAQNVDKGPEWAKANLTPEQINYIRRLIVVREELQFRCRIFELVLDAAPVSSAPASAPLPARKPFVPKVDKSEQAVPPPDRPAGTDAKSPKEPSSGTRSSTTTAKTGQTAKAGAAASDASQPSLRGTLPVNPKATRVEVPTPDRKVKPAPDSGAGN